MLKVYFDESIVRKQGVDPEYCTSVLRGTVVDDSDGGKACVSKVLKSEKYPDITIFKKVKIVEF